MREICVYNDVLNEKEDLFPLATTALRRLEKLTSILNVFINSDSTGRKSTISIK